MVIDHCVECTGEPGGVVVVDYVLYIVLENPALIDIPFVMVDQLIFTINLSP